MKGTKISDSAEMLKAARKVATKKRTPALIQLTKMVDALDNEIFALLPYIHTSNRYNPAYKPYFEERDSLIKKRKIRRAQLQDEIDYLNKEIKKELR